MVVKVLTITGIIFMASVGAQAQLFSDDFDVDSSANWNINASSADTSATFAFDYSAIGVPASPNGGGTTPRAPRLPSPHQSASRTVSGQAGHDGHDGATLRTARSRCAVIGRSVVP